MGRAILFDLDGTLADTAPDLAHALNLVREQRGLAPLPLEPVRRRVSLGSTELVRFSFAIEEQEPGFDALRQQVLAVYRDNLTRRTRLFEGMSEVLEEIERRGHPWGVVTDKPGWLTEPLLAALALSERTACIVSGDTTVNRKPHPEPLLAAARMAGALPADCLYVGDAQRDIEAGRRAGMKTLVAMFGYVDPDQRPERWGADGLIATPRELLSWLD
jgi:phosphoglycolate phosphatase